jgi:hypothetical protein
MTFITKPTWLCDCDPTRNKRIDVPLKTHQTLSTFNRSIADHRPLSAFIGG